MIDQTAGILNEINKVMHKKDLFSIIFILLVSLLPLKTLMKPGLFETHDGRLHVIRLYWFDEELRSGQFPIRWSETANHRYGYPIFNFYYPLLYYLGEIFHLTGLSLVDAFKSLLALAYVASGVAMYTFLRLHRSQFPALVGSILYLYAPFRFVSMYVTGRWAESLVFLALPLAFFGISKAATSGEKKHLSVASLFIGLLILTHNVTAFIFSPILFLWALLLKKRIGIKQIVLVFAGGLAVSAFFWLPAVYETRWTQQGQHPVYEAKDNFPSLKSYLYHPWGYGFDLTGSPGGVSPMLGIAQIVAFSLSIAFVAFSKKSTQLATFAVLFSLAAFFLMNKLSIPLWEKFFVLRTLQFPNRLTVILVFMVSLAMADTIQNFTKNRAVKKAIGLTLIFLAVYGNRNHFRPGVADRYVDQDIVGLYQSIFGVGTASNEVTPVWSQSLPPPYEHKVVVPEDHLFCPNVALSNLVVKPRDYQLTVNNYTQEPYEIQVNTIYYPGWFSAIDNKKTPILYQNQIPPNPFGLIRIQVPKGTHHIRVWFTETPLRRVSNAVSLGSFVVLLLLLKPYQNQKHRSH